VPRLYALGQGVTTVAPPTSSGDQKSPSTDAAPAPARKTGDPARDALGRLLAGHHIGRPKGSATKRVKMAEIAYALTIGNDFYLDALQVRFLWGDVPREPLINPGAN
jgi:hypothetical protein